MSVWSENPEWFDLWLETQALQGRFGAAIQNLAKQGDFLSDEWWDELDRDGKLGQEALTAYVESLVP